MKKVILLVFLCIITQNLSAQTLRKNYSINAGVPIDGSVLKKSLLNDRTGSTVVAPPDYSVPSSNKTSSIETQEVGTASNAFTSITGTANQVFAVDGATDAKDVVGWIHRQNIEVWGGAPATTSNGILRIDLYQGDDIDNCAQDSWKLDLGPLNPMPYPNAGRCRYPQAVPYVPADAKNVNDWKFVWAAPMTDGQGWGNYCWGVTWDLCKMGTKAWNEPKANLSTNFDFLSKRQDGEVLIPGGMCEGRKGEFWFVDNSYKPTGESTGKNGDSIFVFKYVVNKDNNVNWIKKTLKIPNVFFNTKKEQYEVGETNMAFSPDGKWGWVSVMAVINDPEHPGEFEPKPNLFWSDNSGDTWNGPIVIRTRDYPAIVDEIKTRYLSETPGDTLISTGIPVSLGAPDLAVDKFGNPHFFTNFGNTAKANPDLDSLGYFNAFMGMFDVTTSDNGKSWCPKFIHKTVKYQGTIPSSTLSFDNYLQVARDAAGERIFYSWVDDTVTSTQTSAMKPDLHTRALRVSDNAMTATDISTLNDASWKGKIFFPTMAPVVLEKEKGSKFLLPSIFLRLSGNENQPTSYNFIKNRFVNESDFIKPTRDIEMEIVTPTDKICFGENTDVKVKIKNVGTDAVADSFKVSYTINGKGTVSETIKLSTPLAGGASLDYTFKQQANIPVSGSYAFDLSTYWNGDLNCNNHYKERVVLNFGGKAKDIFEKTEAAGCGSVILNTGLTGYAHTWTKDGSPLPDTGPIVSFTEIGSSNIKVEVTSPDCANQKLTDNIKVTVNAEPNITVKPFYQICVKDKPLKISILDGGNTDYEYTWKRYSGTSLSLVASSNEYAVTSNAKLQATIKNKLTGCEIQKDVEVFIWDLVADIKYAKDCGIKALDASGPTTGPGCLYSWYIDDVLKLDKVTSSIFFTETDYEAKPRKYKVVIADPLGCGTSEKTVTIQTFSKQSVDGQDKPLKGIMEYKNYEYNEEGTTKICGAKATDSDDIKDQRAMYFVAKAQAGITKVTGTEWRISPSTAGVLWRPAGAKFVGGKYGGPNTIVTGKVAIYFTSVGRNRKIEYIVHSGNCSDTTNRFIFEVVNSNCEAESAERDSARGIVNPRGDYSSSLVSAKVYPNPSNGKFNVNVDLESVDNLDIEVYDINGRKVHSARFEGKDSYNEMLDLSKVANGIYILKMITEKGFSTQRIVKE